MARVLWLVLFALASGCVKPPDLPRIAEVPSFTLQDQDARARNRDHYAGKVWIASFMFASCKDVCPLLTNKLAGLRTKLLAERPELRFVSFSVDPAHDTPAVLKAFAREHGADQPDWSFLTGTAGDVQQIVIDGFKQSVQRVPGAASTGLSIMHGSHFVLVDRGAYIRGYYRSDQEGILRLERDVRVLLREKRPPSSGGAS